MNDEKLKSLLSAYEVPDAEDYQIETTIRKAHEIKPIKQPTRAYSFFYQIKVQVTYLSKWFYLSCGFLLALHIVLGLLIRTNRFDFSDIYSCLAPFLVIPSSVVLYRTFADRMFELEASCKYSFSKIIAGKMLLLGCLTTVGLVGAWLIGSLFVRSFDVRVILLSLISFSITCTVILWFGRKNMVAGFTAGGLWVVAFSALQLWETSAVYIDWLSDGFLCIILALCIGLVILATITNLKKISLREDAIWNFA